MLCTTSAYAQLSGTYTICSTGGCNYSTIKAALHDLNTKGVSGPVTFNIAAGTYTETYDSLNAIKGSSATNTVTFNGAGMYSSILTAGSGSRALYIDSCSYVSFQNMAFSYTASGNTVYIWHGTDHLTFDHCRFISPLYGTYSTNGIYAYTLNNSTFTNNRFEGGYEGFYHYGYNTTGGFGNNVISHNRFVNYYYAGMYESGYNQYNNTFTYNTTDSTTEPYNSWGLDIVDDNGVTVTNNKCRTSGLYISYPNDNNSSQLCDISNNFIIPSNYSYGYGLELYTSSDNIHLEHNTVYVPAANSIDEGLYVYSSASSPKNLVIANNLIDVEGTINYYGIYLNNSKTNFTTIDGNDFYTGSGAYSAYFLGTAYTDYKSFITNAQAAGFQLHGTNMKPTFVSATNLHLAPGVANPNGINVGITKDIDDDARCVLFPSAGADESNYGKTAKPVSKFYGPSSIFDSAPTTFFNAAKASDPQVYRWYVDGKFVTDSIHLSINTAKYPSVTIALVTIGCGGTDSTYQTFSVGYPSAATVTYFIADKFSIKTNDVVNFTDLSTNGASSWQWDITPDSTFSFGAKVPDYKYVYGSATSQNPSVLFLVSGKYKVCLTASNVLSGGKVGKGNTICKTDYITVLPGINLGSVATTNEPKGYLYDNGGPNANYAPTKTTGNTVQGIVIDACADSTYLIFNSFATECGYDYVKVFDGKDNTGVQLNKKCTGSAGAPGPAGNGPGYDGGGTSCSYTCLPNAGGITDTLKAGRQMYVEMDMDASGNYAGFSAYWWTKSRTSPKPTAKFVSSVDAHHDSICAGGVVTFTNQTTGSEVTNNWELDGDYSDGFEATTQNASWLWIFPQDAVVSLVASNCGGSDTFTKIIHVYAPAAPAANFTADNTNPTINDVVFFTETVPQCVDNFKWTIFKTYKSATDTGNAQFVYNTTRTSANPVVKFTDTGYYSVRMYADNAGGAGKDSLLKTAYIHVKQGYCTPSVATLNTTLGITNVNFAGINKSSSQGVTDYSNYVNDPTASAIVELGVTYPLTLKRDTPFYEAETRTVFIDWNRNGSFNDPGEKVAIDSNDAKNATWTIDIKVPKTASVGATVMRVAANDGNYTNLPCGQNQFGEYEDYRLYVRADKTPPVIYLSGSDSMRIQVGFPFVEPGDSAWDNLNGNITANIKRTVNRPNSFSLSGPEYIPGTYVIAYNVSDSTGNAAVTRYRYITVVEDTIAPDLVVAGPDTTFVPVDKSSSSFVTLPTVSSSIDLVDGTMSDTITPQYIPVNKLDTVKVMYSTADLSGNRAVVYRYVIVYDNIAPVLTLKGKATQTIQVGSSYADSGVDAKDNYYTSTELAGLVKEVNGVNTKKIGTYTITYTLTDPSGNAATPVTRTIHVVDTVAPAISLNGSKSDTIEVYTTYNDAGVTVSDNYYASAAVSKTGTYYSNFSDGKATKLGTYTIIYTAKDSSGNSASVTRFVTVVDKIAPVISLVGTPTEAVCRWSDYIDSGYTVKDNFYATVKVDTEGTFYKEGRTNLPGLYNIRYKATDGSGNVSYSDYRYVLVRSANDELCKTGIKEGLSLDKYINVYPNPTSGQLNIKANLPAAERVTMTITNALGQTLATVSNGNLSQNSFTVDLSGQSAGMYMLNIITAHDKVTKQIMLTK
jgi:hypothetical protein